MSYLRSFFFLLAATFPITSQAAAPVWKAKNTRVVVVSLAGFQGEKAGQTSFSTSDRLDDPLIGKFMKIGVPEDNILYLKDNNATTKTVTELLPAFLADSKEDETLIFYYSSHGGYDPVKGGHTFTTFDGSMSIGWFVGKIEKEFKGPRAMLFSDCCFSGGLVDLVKARPAGRTSIGALSTTGSHNLGYSGWRFTDLLIRAWQGDVAMDADESGSVEFLELCVFAESYMAFVAEGKPLYAVTGNFPPGLVLAKVDREAKEGIGFRVEAKEGDTWYKAEIVDLETNDDGEPKRLQVHFTDKNRYDKVMWLAPEKIREFTFTEYEKGTEVEIRDATGKWVPGTVIDSFESMHECHYEGKSTAYDEWMSPSRIRKPVE